MGGRNRRSGAKASDGTRERGRLYCAVAGLLVVTALHVGPRLAPRQGATARVDVDAVREPAAPADRAVARPIPVDFTGAVPLRAERPRRRPAPPRPELELEPEPLKTGPQPGRSR